MSNSTPTRLRTYQLPDEVRALLSYALAICSGRGSREVVGLDVVLAALARDSSQRPSDPSAATYQLTAALPQQPPPQARVDAALSSLGVDTAAAAFQRTIDPVAEAALDTALAAADRAAFGGRRRLVVVASRRRQRARPGSISLNRWRRRSVRPPTTSAARFAKASPNVGRTRTSRRGIGSSVPLDAVLAMHEQARQRLELAVALTRSRGGTAHGRRRRAVRPALRPPTSACRRRCSIRITSIQWRPRLTEAMVERYGAAGADDGRAGSTDPTLRSLTVVHRATAVARATTGQPTVQIEHLLAVAVTGDMPADRPRTASASTTSRSASVRWRGSSPSCRPTRPIGGRR